MAKTLGSGKTTTINTMTSERQSLSLSEEMRARKQRAYKNRDCSNDLQEGDWSEACRSQLGHSHSKCRFIGRLLAKDPVSAPKRIIYPAVPPTQPVPIRGPRRKMRVSFSSCQGVEASSGSSPTQASSMSLQKVVMHLRSASMIDCNFIDRVRWDEAHILVDHVAVAKMWEINQDMLAFVVVVEDDGGMTPLLVFSSYLSPPGPMPSRTRQFGCAPGGSCKCILECDLYKLPLILKKVSDHVGGSARGNPVVVLGLLHHQ
ncbi:hypothetical protein SELMODRAFT_405445 [Selaginella moellendorffii]|uniref:Uncharacterized protein n=1 Tax=Selaginella moellendorffii TaxID=88036 RepID=D8QYL4_SELML|nr:hypothetical protein SELMODRAFT_405445 [Selaginella moellendorffii]